MLHGHMFSVDQLSTKNLSSSFLLQCTDMYNALLSNPFWSQITVKEDDVVGGQHVSHNVIKLINRDIFRNLDL